MTMKIRSIRADEQVLEKFKAISEEYANQSEALSALITAWEMNNSRTVLPSMEKDIATFSGLVQSLQSLYLNALELNNNTELRVRQEFAEQLKSKDRTIEDLQLKSDAAEMRAQTALNDREQIQQVANENVKEAQAAQRIAEQSAESAREAQRLAEERAEDKTALAKTNELRIADLQRQIVDRDKRIEQLEEAEKDSQRYRDEIEELTGKILEQQKRAEQAESELEKQKVMAAMAAERAEVVKQQAILEERTKQSDKIQELYSELNELRKELSRKSTKTSRSKTE